MRERVVAALPALAPRLLPFVNGTLSVLTSTLVVFAFALFVAVDPRAELRWVARLVPERHDDTFDEPDILDSVGAFLRQHGLGVLTATSAADAKKILAYCKVDIIVADHQGRRVSRVARLGQQGWVAAVENGEVEATQARAAIAGGARERPSARDVASDATTLRVQDCDIGAGHCQSRNARPVEQRHGARFVMHAAAAIEQQQRLTLTRLWFLVLFARRSIRRERALRLAAFDQHCRLSASERNARSASATQCIQRSVALAACDSERQATDGRISRARALERAERAIPIART
jgi:hypothetical protein